MTDTLLVDGQPFPSYVTLAWPYEWPYDTPEDSAATVTFPGVDGGEMGDTVYPARVLSLPVAVAVQDDECPDDEDAAMALVNERYREARALCKPGRNVTLTRRVSLPGDVTSEQTARARFVNLTPTREDVALTTGVLDWMLLDGLWYDVAATIPASGTSPRTVTVAGDARTHRMTITLTGSGSRTLTNTTNGYSLTYTGTGGLTLDVETMKVTAGNPSKLSWKRRLPFRLDPGENVLTLSSGTAAITYRPAYL